jgi:hypothetical protein
MLAGAEHSCVMFYFLRKHSTCRAKHALCRLETLKLQSVSLLYNAQQGDLDVADARGGA